MPFELPLFPLDVVLFPGMLLPLHIFEERYKLMTSRCLEASTPFGVVLRIGGDGGDRTVTAAIGCEVEILEATPLEDGRYNLQTVGRRRFRVLSVRPQDGYLIGTVDRFDDIATENEAAPLANQALRSLRRYLGAIGTNLGESRGAVGVPANAYDLSMWIAAILAVPNRQKQELLDLRSTADRLQREAGLLRRAEVVHAAWTRRQTWPPPREMDDATLPSKYAEFFSLN